MENDYFKMWVDDKKSIIATMMRNIAADLAAGYNPLGDCIARQRKELREYEAEYERELMALAEKSEAQAARWCKMDLIRRGAIEI